MTNNCMHVSLETIFQCCNVRIADYCLQSEQFGVVVYQFSFGIHEGIS